MFTRNLSHVYLVIFSYLNTQYLLSVKKDDKRRARDFSPIQIAPGKWLWRRVAKYVRVTLLHRLSGAFTDDRVLLLRIAYTPLEQRPILTEINGLIVTRLSANSTRDRRRKGNWKEIWFYNPQRSVKGCAASVKYSLQLLPRQ